ncbi:MAG: transcription termination/antitermination protein NusA [Acidobacteria bacterium]|nr:MAG: transcription termination/antitermination protein NusA [Acidobacteriota bacterium]
MTNILYQQIDQLSKEKGINPEIVVSAVEDAVLVATRKFYKSNEDLRSTFNKETGQVEVYAIKKIVENVTNPVREISLESAQKIDASAEVNGEVKIQKATDVLGRIAAQTAKQVILQKVREAERDSIFAEYSQRIGEVVTCMVKRTEGGDIIVDLGTTEGRLPKREQSRLESFMTGDRIRVVISKVEKTTKGPQVIVSRTDPALLIKLFEMEVPEIYDGTVVIRAAARDTGERAKVAVFSKDKDVDPVGACVGMKGSRVQAIIRELHGEKIDIIAYSEDPVSFVTNALSPAKIGRASIIDIMEKHIEVIVESDQLSLAIGKKGQNVRLAAKLAGWKIDIKSDEEKRAEIEDQMAQMAAKTPLAELPGLSEGILQKLSNSGISTIEELADTPIAELTNIKGVGPKSAEKIIASVKDYYLKLSEVSNTEEAASVVEGTPGEMAQKAAVGAGDEGEAAVKAGGVAADQSLENPAIEAEPEPDGPITAVNRVAADQSLENPAIEAESEGEVKDEEKREE